MSGYTVRPPEARQKPRVSAFINAKFDKIEALRPDLVLAFSDLQADLAAELVRRGIAVVTFNQRTVAEILQMIRMLGGLVGCQPAAEALADQLERRARRRFASRRRGFHTGCACFSRNGTSRSSRASDGSRSSSRSPAAHRSFPELADARLAKDRIVDPRGSGTARSAGRVRVVVRKENEEDDDSRRPGWDAVSAVRDDRIFEMKSTYILQPGPASLTEGVGQLHSILQRLSRV